MKGQVLGYSLDTGTGAISGEDGSRYTFTREEWKDDGLPGKGAKVDFEVLEINETRYAIEIYQALGTAGSDGSASLYRPTAGAAAPLGDSQSKKKGSAALLAILLGVLGVHKFYLGYKDTGIIFLLAGTVGWITLGLLPAIFLTISVIEGVIYLTKTDEEFHRIYVLGRREWF